MRIVEFVNSLEIGGTERQVVNLTRGLRDAGFDVELACFLAQGGLVDEVRRLRVPLHRVPDQQPAPSVRLEEPDRDRALSAPQPHRRGARQRLLSQRARGDGGVAGRDAGDHRLGARHGPHVDGGAAARAARGRLPRRRRGHQRARRWPAACATRAGTRSRPRHPQRHRAPAAAVGTPDLRRQLGHPGARAGHRRGVAHHPAQGHRGLHRRRRWWSPRTIPRRAS